jgi:hypothetical protein
MSRTRLKLTEPIEREPLVNAVVEMPIRVDTEFGLASAGVYLATEDGTRKKLLREVTVPAAGTDTLGAIEERLLLAAGRAGTIERNGRDEPLEPTGDGGGR